MRAVFQREMRFLTLWPLGWVFVGGFLLLCGISTFIINVQGGSPFFGDNLVYLALSMALFCGLIGASAFSSENRDNTRRLLYAMPLSSAGIVAGKLLARAVCVLFVSLVLVIYPVALGLAADPTAIGSGALWVISVFVLCLFLGRCGSPRLLLHCRLCKHKS